LSTSTLDPAKPVYRTDAGKDSPYYEDGADGGAESGYPTVD
jgi:hypothetical protein